MKCIKCGKEVETITLDGMCEDCWSKQLEKEYPSAMYGWICPRCGIVHSPFVQQCGCPPPIKYSNGMNTEDIQS